MPRDIHLIEQIDNWRREYEQSMAEPIVDGDNNMTWNCNHCHYQNSESRASCGSCSRKRFLKIAIVGSSILNIGQAGEAQRHITRICNNYHPDVIISGGATGIDTLAEEFANDVGIKTEIYKPEKQSWEYFKIRNEKIASMCDNLLNIVIKSSKPDGKGCFHCNGDRSHVQSGGCYTMKLARKLGKHIDIKYV